MSLQRSGALALTLALAWGFTAQAQQIDLSTIVQAPPKVTLGEGIKLGYRVETEMKSGGMTTRSFTAIVGETEDAWEIESNQMTAGYASMPGGKGLVMAMVVDKKTLEVLSAKIGVPGGGLKEIKIMDSKSFPKAKAKPAGEPEEFTLPSGAKVMATVTTSKAGGQTFKSWVGAKGTELEGILLKTSGSPRAAKELSSDPVEIDYELKDLGSDGKPNTVVARELTYTDKSKVVMTKDPVAKCLNYGMLSATGPAYQVKVLSLRTDAKPTLAWK